MCIGICHLYKYSSFPNPNQRLVTMTSNLFFSHLTNFCVGQDMMTQEDSFGLGHVERLEPGQEPHSWDQESKSTTPQQQGYWEHWGKLGETGMSLLYSSERNQWALSEFKGQNWPLYCTCPKERWEMKGGRWGWATKGWRAPSVVPWTPSPDLAYHSQKAASMCPYR